MAPFQAGSRTLIPASSSPGPGPTPGSCPAARHPGSGAQPLPLPWCPPASHLRGSGRRTRSDVGAAKRGCAWISRCEVEAAALGAKAAAGRRLSAPGRFRCGEILEGLGDQQAQSLKHHVPRGPGLSVCDSETNRPLNRRTPVELHRTHSGPPFCNSNLTLKTNSKKREERNARVRLLRKRIAALVSSTTFRGQWDVTRRMRLATWKPSPGGATLSRACARRPQPGSRRPRPEFTPVGHVWAAVRV